MEKKTQKIFISYRREGGIQTARWVHDQLQSRGYDVFLDMECLGGGSFNENLLTEIASRDVMLVILTRGSLKRRYFREDWVRKEVAHAFKSGLKVVPLRDQGFKFPGNLPRDIAHLAMQNGPEINMAMAKPWLDMLETQFICSQPQKPIIYPPLPAAFPWPRYVAGGLAAAALCGAVYLGANALLGDRAPEPTEQPSSQTNPNGKPTGTLPSGQPIDPVFREQILGNSPGNQCNDGVCESGSWYLTGNSVHYNNALDNWRYHYRDSDKTITVRHVDEENATTVATIPGVGYLLVTTDWFFYSVESGNVATLYRAPRLAVDQMGEAEVIASGFSSNNNVMVDGTAAYYWYTGRGLYSLDLTTGTESRLLELETTWSADTFGLSGDWIYLHTATEIQRLKITTGEVQTVLDVTQEIGSVTLSACNVDSAWVYFVVADGDTKGYVHNDRIYRMHTNGTNLERIYVAERADCHISYIGLQTDQDQGYKPGFVAKKMIIAYDCASKRNSIYVDTGKYTFRNHEHEEPFEQTLGVHVGNCVTNLCNDGFVTYLPEEGVYSYRTPAQQVYLNRFGTESGSYYYDRDEGTVVMRWTENDESQSVDLLKDVTCRYIFVTPDWFYCVLEEGGVNTLYRAENDPEHRAIGELEAVVSGFVIKTNNIAIHEGYVYYWMDDDGLYRCRIDGTDATRVWDQASTGWRTFYVTEDSLYFVLSKGGFYRANLAEGTHTSLYSYDEEPGIIRGAVEKDGLFYYIVSYDEEGEPTQPDEIWSIMPDGTEKTLVCTMEDVTMRAVKINRSAGNILIRVEQDEQIYLYTLDPSTGSLTLSATHS